MTVSANLTLKNKKGLHGRTSALLVKTLLAFDSPATITFKGKTVDARSIMSLFVMGAAKDDELFLEADGEDAGELVAKLTDLIEVRKFYEQ